MLLVPNAFHGLPQSGAENGSGAALLYFSFSTLTTAGFGDIMPLHPIARNLANLEAVIGQLFPATLVSEAGDAGARAQPASPQDARNRIGRAVPAIGRELNYWGRLSRVSAARIFSISRAHWSVREAISSRSRCAASG